MTDAPKTYHVVAINGKSYHVSPNLAALVEAVVADTRCNAMAKLAFDWLHLHIEQNQPGGTSARKTPVRIEITGGCREQ